MRDDTPRNTDPKPGDEINVSNFAGAGGAVDPECHWGRILAEEAGKTISHR